MHLIVYGKQPTHFHENEWILFNTTFDVPDVASIPEGPRMLFLRQSDRTVEYDESHVRDYSYLLIEKLTIRLSLEKRRGKRLMNTSMRTMTRIEMHLEFLLSESDHFRCGFIGCCCYWMIRACGERIISNDGFDSICRA